jgi:hypothetical protein
MTVSREDVIKALDYINNHISFKEARNIGVCKEEITIRQVLEAKEPEVVSKQQYDDMLELRQQEYDTLVEFREESDERVEELFIECEKLKKENNELRQKLGMPLTKEDKQIAKNAFD